MRVARAEVDVPAVVLADPLVRYDRGVILRECRPGEALVVLKDGLELDARVVMLSIPHKRLSCARREHEVEPLA